MHATIKAKFLLKNDVVLADNVTRTVLGITVSPTERSVLVRFLVGGSKLYGANESIWVSKPRPVDVSASETLLKEIIQ